jgi:hypothetical protein
MVATNESETAQSVMARFAEGDNNTGAYDARMMGFTNTGLQPVQPLDVMEEDTALVPNSDKF